MKLQQRILAISLIMVLLLTTGGPASAAWKLPLKPADLAAFPGQAISRLQFACLLAKTLGVQPYFPAEAHYQDLPAGAVEAGYVEALTELGIIAGQEQGVFGGAALVSPQEAAQLFAKASTLLELTDTVSASAYQNPQPKLTRLESARLFARLRQQVLSSSKKNQLNLKVTSHLTENYIAAEQPGEPLPVTSQVIAELPDAFFKKTESQNYPGPATGITASDSRWTGFLRQQGRSLLIDLGQLTNVSGVTLEFRQKASQGVFVPQSFQLAASAEGGAWYQLGTVASGLDPADRNLESATCTLTFPALTTRYLKLSFPVEVWTLARQLSVQGAEAVEKPIILPPEAITEDRPAFHQDQVSKDILLIYTGKKDEQHTYTGNDFLPMVAYISPLVKLQGTMFDTMLFLPYLKMPSTKTAWTAYLDDLFTPKQQLDALDATIQRVNKLTGSTKKEKVILTLPYPDSSESVFENEVSFSTSDVGKEQAFRNRTAAVQWYYQELAKRWASADFQNLDLIGVYWFEESIDYANYQEVQLVQRTANLAREQGHKFYWIPYYGAAGVANWRQLGFSDVFVQPNFYATAVPPAERMNNAATFAKRYHTGLQIELDNRVYGNPVYAQLFYQELRKAKQLGLEGDMPTAYHIGTKGTILDGAYSIFPEMRRIYDDLYRWIKGTFQ